METIGRYELTAEIGQGGMGSVYHAWDSVLGRDVALKWLSPFLAKDGPFAEQFWREARLIARLEHPHIIPIYDMGVHQGRPYLVMRWLNGGTLRDRVAAGLSLSTLLQAMYQVASALDTAHQHGVVHRDIKPTNILFDEQSHPFVADFGIAQVANQTGHITGSQLPGTPLYMSPEQFARKQVEGRSDQYSLAVVLFEALTGEPPYSGDTLQVMYQHVHADIPLAHQVNSRISPLLSEALAKALAKQPENRFPSATAFVSALQDAAATAQQTAVILPYPSPEFAVPLTPTAPIPGYDHSTQFTPLHNPAREAAPQAVSATRPPIKTGAGGRNGSRRRRPFAVTLFVLLILFLVMGTALFWPYLSGVIQGPNNSGTGNTPAPLALLHTPPPSTHLQLISGDNLVVQADNENLTLTTDGLWPVYADHPVTLQSQGEIIQLALMPEQTLTLLPDTTLAISTNGSAQGQIDITLEQGQMVVKSATSITIRNPFGAQVQLASGVAGVAYTATPLRFVVDCLAGECQVAGDLGGHITLSEGQRTIVGGSGHPGDAEPAHYEAFAAAVAFVPTPTMTSTPTMTPTPTRTAKPTATPSPSLFPSPTVVSIASATPTRLPATSVSDAPVSTGLASNGPGLPLTLEEDIFGRWARGNEPNGTFTSSASVVHTGGGAARLDYDFHSDNNDYVVFMQINEIPGNPNTISVWVYGDRSAHFLNIWILDNDEQTWAVPVGQITHAGWRQMTGYVDPAQDWPWQHIAGPNNGQVDYPIRFRGFVLDDYPDSYNGNGTIYLDDVTAAQTSGIVAASTRSPLPPPGQSGAGQTQTAVPATAPALAAGEVGRIVYTAGNALFTTDPAWQTPVMLNQSGQNSCGSSITLVNGLTFQLSRGYYCGIIEGPQTCSSPDGNFQVTTSGSFGSGFSISIKGTRDEGDEQFIYNGHVDTAEGIRWSPLSNGFLFVIGDTVYLSGPDGGYREIIPIAYEPMFSPDGSAILYRKPIGPGVNDVFVSGADGSNPVNVTNVSTIDKRCAVWVAGR